MLHYNGLPGSRRHVDLKRSLTTKIVIVAWLCFAAASAIALYATFRDADALNQKTAVAISKILELQLFRIQAALDVKQSFPDWSGVIDHVTVAGQCVRYLDPKGHVVQSECAGLAQPESYLEGLYAALFASLSGPAETLRKITFKGNVYGAVSVTMTPEAIALRSWAEVARLLGLAFASALALSTLAYTVIARALSPAGEILRGLDRLAAGDHACRLPEFALIEFQRISEVFNALAARLDQSRQENALLARKLVDTQEVERRRIAQELHDELAQSMTGVSAIAASIRAEAQHAFPRIAEEAALLSATVSRQTRSLRATLTNLRPQELDDLGLEASLRALIGSIEIRNSGRLHIKITIDGSLDRLSPTASGHVYRIVQEALTNVERHAGARQASVTLACEPRHGAGMTSSELGILIEDDGVGIKAAETPPGFGLVGMRERVIALGGDIVIEKRETKGLMIRATIPLDGDSVRSS